MGRLKFLCLLLTLWVIELTNASEQRHLSAGVTPESHTNPAMSETPLRENYTIPVTLGIAGIIAAQKDMESLVVIYPDGKKQETKLTSGAWRDNRFNLDTVDASSLSRGKFNIYYTSPYAPDRTLSLTECVFQPSLDPTKKITKIRIHVTSVMNPSQLSTTHSCIAELVY